MAHGVQDVLRSLKARCVELYLEDGRLRARFRPGAYTDELRALVDANRSALIAHLTTPPSDRCSRCGAEHLTVALEMEDGTFLCRKCFLDN